MRFLGTGGGEGMPNPFCSVRRLLYTHTHDDHFNYTVIWERFVRQKGGDEPMNIYFTDSAYDITENFICARP